VLGLSRPDPVVNTAPDHTPNRKEPPMAKSYKLTESQIPERRTQSLYADVVADFIAQGAESVEVTIEGMKPATLRAGLRRALKEVEGARLAQRGEETYLIRRNAAERED
jgi:hypothetical protein